MSELTFHTLIDALWELFEADRISFGEYWNTFSELQDLRD